MKRGLEIMHAANSRKKSICDQEFQNSTLVFPAELHLESGFSREWR